MRAFKNFYTANFENIRSEMTKPINEELRIFHTPSFAVGNENSFWSFALNWLNSSENGLTDIAKNKYSRICKEYIFPFLENTDCMMLAFRRSGIRLGQDVRRMIWMLKRFERLWEGRILIFTIL